MIQIVQAFDRTPILSLSKRTLALALSGSLMLANTPACAVPTTLNPSAVSAPSKPQQTPAQLQQLVAPIALYPDPLVAQIFAASTYPAEVVEADRWLKQHPDLKGQQLADEVDKQPWDSSVKALTEFPSVLANLDRNLSWTSSLGKAYLDQPQDLMDAVQDMRRRAQNAGHLQSTPQQKVTTQGQTIEILPTNPDVVYVPEYDPWLVYGPPIAAWPGWYPYPGLYLTTPGIVFGLGIGVGLFGGFAWGWHNWGFDWAHGTVAFNHSAYISHNASFINRRAVMDRHPVINHHAFVSHNPSLNHSIHGVHSGAYNDFHHAGVARSYASRGRSGFAGRFHGFAGGFHGGGFHGARFAGFHGGGRR